MRHQRKVKKLSKKPAHRKAMLANMAVSLFVNGQIKTTTAKAKALRELVERLITFAKKGDLNSRRIVLSRLKCKSRSVKTTVNFLFDEIAPIYQDREGGYTRILKYGFRKGDNSEISLMKLIDYEGLNFVEYEKGSDKKKSSPKTTETKTEVKKPAAKEQESEAIKDQTSEPKVEANAEVIEKKEIEAETDNTSTEKKEEKIEAKNEIADETVEDVETEEEKPEVKKDTENKE